jgi:hypothetical protein
VDAAAAVRTVAEPVVLDLREVMVAMELLEMPVAAAAVLEEPEVYQPSPLVVPAA